MNFSPIGKGSSFTQQDVANGYIYYLNDGTEGSGNSEPATPDDKFTFTISDGDKEQVNARSGSTPARPTTRRK